MRRERRDAGFTLVELLVTMLVMLVVLGATLTSLEVFTRGQARTSGVNLAQDAAREAVDRISRELRNVAAPGGAGPLLERMAATDLVVRTFAPAGGLGSRTRYCLDARDPLRQTLWRQSQTWSTATPPPLPSSAACPDAGWPASTPLAENLVAPAGGVAYPFTYDGASAGAVTRVGVRLAVQIGPAGTPARELASGVTLRNQNRPPVAALSATPTGRGRVLLNGTNSADPDDQTITFAWRDGTTAIGTTGVVDYQAPATGTRTFSLTVTDPGGLTSTATTTVTVQ